MIRSEPLNGVMVNSARVRHERTDGPMLHFREIATSIRIDHRPQGPEKVRNGTRQRMLHFLNRRIGQHSVGYGGDHRRMIGKPRQDFRQQCPDQASRVGGDMRRTDL